MNRPTPLDRRLLAAGPAVTVADLVAVFVDHRCGQADACGTCRHRYTTAAPLCPSAVLARQLLKHRQHEDRAAVAAITKELNTTRDDRTLPAAQPRREATPQTAELFAVEPAWRKPRTPRY